MPSGAHGYEVSRTEWYPEKGLEASPTASCIPSCPDFQCVSLLPSLPYIVKARSIDLYSQTGTGSSTALILSGVLIERINRNFGENIITSVVFLDVCKAFDTVCIDDPIYMLTS